MGGKKTFSQRTPWRTSSREKIAKKKVPQSSLAQSRTDKVLRDDA